MSSSSQNKDVSHRMPEGKVIGFSRMRLEIRPEFGPDSCRLVLLLLANDVQAHELNRRLHEVFSTPAEVCKWLFTPHRLLLDIPPSVFIGGEVYETVLFALERDLSSDANDD